MNNKEIDDEVMRYASGPGQALAYKVDELIMRYYRIKLGPELDTRAFHRIIVTSVDLKQARSRLMETFGVELESLEDTFSLATSALIEQDVCTETPTPEVPIKAGCVCNANSETQP